MLNFLWGIWLWRGIMAFYRSQFGRLQKQWLLVDVSVMHQLHKRKILLYKLKSDLKSLSSRLTEENVLTNYWLAQNICITNDGHTRTITISTIIITESRNYRKKKTSQMMATEKNHLMVILSSLKAGIQFLTILTPSSLFRCPSSWDNRDKIENRNQGRKRKRNKRKNRNQEWKLKRKQERKQSTYHDI